MIIAPSILSADLLNLGQEISSIENAGADWIHVDVMDGHYVPNLTFGPDIVAQLHAKTKLPLDVHLMITPVDYTIEAFAKAGAARLTVHPDAEIHAHRTLQKIGSFGISAGIAVNPGTSIGDIEHLLPLVDLVLFMSVNPGFGGQAFIPETLDKIRNFKQSFGEKYRGLHIEVDGGINAETAKLVREAGANALVAGNYIFKDGDKTPQGYQSRINALRGK